MHRLDREAYLDVLQRDVARLADIAAGDLTPPVPSCPGWDVARLIGHVGRVQRMVLAVVPSGTMQPPDPASMEPVPRDAHDLRAYFQSGGERLVTLLRDTPPDTPAWNFTGDDLTAAFWSRRQAHEHAMHRWDAQAALGAPEPIDAALALDGIDEYFEIANARVLPKRDGFALGGTIHLHATDAPGEWMLADDGGRIAVSEGHGKGDAAVRGTASDLLLGLWGRVDLATDARFERFGDAAIVAALASIGGN